MTRALEGRRIVVTGSSEGIGRAVALHLAGEGARVVVNASGLGSGGVAAAEDRLAGLVAEVADRGGEGLACVASVAELAGAEAIVGTAVDGFGGLDGLVNCAGIAGAPANSLCEIEVEDWRRVVSTHLDGTFFCCRAAVPHLIAAGGGAIVNTSSHGFLGGFGGSAYPAAKGAINSLSFAIAADLASDGIRCNVVCPGAKTRLSTGTAYEAVIGRLEQRGLLDAEGVAASLNAPPAEGCAPIYGYLLSDHASHITGRLFSAAGGYVGVFARAEERAIGVREEGDGTWTIDALADAVAKNPEGSP